MSTAKFIDVHVGDEVRLRKPHACGGTDWTVVRLGADIGLVCQKCQHRILLARGVFERRLKNFLSHAVSPDPAASSSPIEPGSAEVETVPADSSTTATGLPEASA